MKEAFSPKGMATGIGSLPHESAAEAVLAVLKYLPQCPFWPQLPRRSALEGMILQYASGFPGLFEENGTVKIDTDLEGHAGLMGLYENFLGKNEDHFALKIERAEGFYAFVEALKNKSPKELCYIKGHVTGPVTLASGLKDTGGRELINDETFRDAVSRQIAMNALWQAKTLSGFGKEVIIFLDEPVMEVYGSAYSTLDQNTVLSLWDPVLNAIEEGGAISGIHCCGNTDWELLFGCGVDIVNFDAFTYTERLMLYAEKISEFIGSGGVMAFGIVPTDSRIREVTVEGLYDKLMFDVDMFAMRGVDEAQLRRQCLLTPSCGMGSLPLEEALMVLEKLSALSEKCRKEWKNL